MTLIGYSDDDHQNNPKRKFANEVTGVPTHKSRLEETTHYEFVAQLGGAWDYEGRRIGENYFDEEKADKLAEEIEEATDGEVKLVKETETDEVHEASLSQAGKTLTKELTKNLPDEINDSVRQDMWVARWQDDVGRVKVNISSANWEHMRILSKEENRENDNLFESLTERPCARISIELSGESEEELDDLTEQMVTPVHKALAKQDAIGKVRYMDCTVTTKREGDCYNI